MKKNYLLGLILFLPLLISSQPYFNSGATWYYGMWPNDTSSYIKIEKTGEVWVGGKFCDELKFSEYNPSNSPIVYVYYHYTYQSGDSVMIHRDHNNTFGVLYNFDWTTGDTTSCCMCVQSFILDSVNSLSLVNTNLRAQYFHLTVHSFITYEKIGNTGFFIPWMNNMNPSFPGWQLRCYQDNTGLYLHTGYSQSCDDGNNSHNSASLQLMAAPFAVTAVSQFIQPGTEISVYDVLGRIVARETADQSNSCYVEMQIDARAVYCVTIRNGDHFLSEKFVQMNSW